MATDKWVARLEAKLDALLEKNGLKPADYEDMATSPSPAPRKLTEAEQQAIDNAPKAEATIPPQGRGARMTAENAPDTSSSVPSADKGAPWAGYDEATADEVVERMRGMSDAERQRALSYERANKNRVSITRVNWNS